MKTLLVPTDFSPCANNAYRFALRLADTMSGKIILMHAFQVPVVPGPVPADMISDTAALLEKQCAEKLERFARDSKGVNVETLCATGFTVETILETAKQFQPSMTVMGTQGESGLMDKLLGSNASGVITKSHVPVLVVPQDAGFAGLSNVIYATDFASIDRTWMQELVEWMRPFNARITCLHISKDGLSSERVQMADLKDRLWLETETFNVSFDMIRGDDIEQGLTEYAEQHKANLIVMMSHRRNWLERLFTKSLTKKMTLHSHIPLLMFPEK